jgi:Raf kinase inhibitor-like YbhB/YbcL family protein
VRSGSQFTLVSPAFNDGERVPQRHTCDGEDVSPSLEWSGAPASTASYALIVYDPDAPRGTFVHWVIYDIPRELTALPEGVPRDPVVEGLGIQGRNDFGKYGYGGPCPPRGDRPHRYVFLVMALDIGSLGLEPGAPCNAVIEAARGHVVGYGYTYGVYSR